MLFFHFRLGNTIICHSPKSCVKSAIFVDSSTLAFAFGIQTYMDIKNGIKNPLCCNGNLFPNVDGRGALEIAYFLACFTDLCYYCFSNNSRTVRLIPLASGQRKIRRNFRRISCTCCECYDGMEEHRFPKVFPYFFPLSGYYTTCHMVHTVHFENWSELNDTKCGRLATNGLSLANSNPSSIYGILGPLFPFTAVEAWILPDFQKRFFGFPSVFSCMRKPQ